MIRLPMGRLYLVSFRAFLLPEGFGCPAAVVILAETSKEAVASAARWYQRNQPYNVRDADCEACLENFDVIELEYFVCYGVARTPLVWEFPLHLRTAGT